MIEIPGNLRPIPTYEHYYATVDGEIYSTRQNKLHKLKPQRVTKSKKGYWAVRLFAQPDSPNYKEKGKMCYIHRLVWETFSGEIPDNMQIDHIDTDTSNNNLNNLRCVTGRENKKKYHNNNTNWRKRRKEFVELYEQLGTYTEVAKVVGCAESTAWYVINNMVLTKNKETDGYVYTEFKPR